MLHGRQVERKSSGILDEIVRLDLDKLYLDVSLARIEDMDVARAA